MLENSENNSPNPSTETQDRDLYQRLNQYLNRVEEHLRQGRGWFIFNADQSRSARITRLFMERLREHQPYITFKHVPWRDFSLNAYMTDQIHATANQPEKEDAHRNNEYTIARLVTSNTSLSMITSDMLIISELVPRNRQEVNRLGQVVVGRHTRQMATVLVTPKMPHELAQSFEELSDSPGHWNEFFRRMYESSLLAF